MMRGASLDQLRHWRVAVPKDRLIYDEGEAPKAFYRVERGCIRLQVNRDDGRRQILALCLPGDVLGIEFDRIRTAAAEASAPSELTRFPSCGLTGASLEVRSMAGLVAAASDMVSTLSFHLKGMGHGSAEDRLMWFLDWLAERRGVSRQGGAVQPPMSRRDIADFLGLAQETLSRTFARLEAQRLLYVADKRRVILRPGPRPTTSGGVLERAA